jgi:hypothetical protein
MKWIKKNVTAIVISVAGTIISAIIMNIVGIINWDWFKNLFEKILEYKLSVIVIIISIIVIVIIVKYFSYIRKFFKWLFMKYLKFIWKITGIEKRFKEENIRWEMEFKEVKKQFEILKKELAIIQKSSFYHFLKGKFSDNLSINIEIIVKSKTFKNTKAGYECNSDDYGKHYNRIDRPYEDGFEIIALEYRLKIPYEILCYWQFDELNNKIHLYLKKALVLHPNEKLELEDLQCINN